MSPEYDLVCAVVAMKEAKAEIGLSINVCKRNLTKIKFEDYAANLKVPQNDIANIYQKFSQKLA